MVMITLYAAAAAPAAAAAAAAAAAKSLQLCPTLCDPIDGSPPDSFVSGILQARILEWDNPVCETAKETQTYRTVFWTLWERERVG